MENSSYAPPRPMDPSRPSIGFPLGTALLLIVIFSLSGVFSCCYHWEKIRSLRRSMSGEPDLEADSHDPPSKPKSPYMVIFPLFFRCVSVVLLDYKLTKIAKVVFNLTIIKFLKPMLSQFLIWHIYVRTMTCLKSIKT